MPLRSNKTFNKHGLLVRWPRVWIIILGIILIFLCFCIAGMEIGHTIFDLYRSTAFGGFIVFIPLILCTIFVLISACKPKLIILRIAVLLCCIMIILCMALIAYDILVLIDPTRCFFLNCNDASVNVSNSTDYVLITGWPLYITWPDYFQTNMNAKRIFQSIQILCAGLFILFSSLYLLTYIIYRHIKIKQTNLSKAEHRTFTTYDTTRTSTNKNTNSLSQSYSNSYPKNNKVTVYKLEGSTNSSMKYRYSPTGTTTTTTTTTIPKKVTTKPEVQSKANSINYERLCTRCNQEPRMILISNYEKEYFYPHLCINCNNEILNTRKRLTYDQTKSIPPWKP